MEAVMNRPDTEATVVAQTSFSWGGGGGGGGERESRTFVLGIGLVHLSYVSRPFFFHNESNPPQPRAQRDVLIDVNKRTVMKRVKERDTGVSVSWSPSILQYIGISPPPPPPNHHTHTHTASLE